MSGILPTAVNIKNTGSHSKRNYFNSYRCIIVISLAAYLFGGVAQAQEPATGAMAELILEAETAELSSKNVYQGLAYSDSGNQLMSWDREGNVRIYDISKEKPILKKQGAHTSPHNIFWHPEGISFKDEERKCVWYPSLGFYNTLIQTKYEPTPDFGQLRTFLEKSRRINPETSAIVKEYCRTLEFDDFSGVSTLAYDDQQRLIPVISHYNDPVSANKQNAAGAYKFLATSQDMNTLAYHIEGSTAESAETGKIIFFRNQKPWRTCSLKELWTRDSSYLLAPCCLSPDGNLACIVLYKFPSFGRHIGSADWFKSIFQSYRKHISVIIYDIESNRILHREDWAGFSGETKQLIWRAAFCQGKREFVLLNGVTGTLKMYRY